MLLDLLFCYVAGGIGCSLVCVIMQYMSLRKEYKGVNKDNLITLGVIGILTFILWPVLIVTCIVWDIRDIYKKKK